MNNYSLMTRQLTDFIERSPSCYHTVKNISEMLKDSGMIPLSEEAEWSLEEGKGYFVVRADSSVIAFKIPYNCSDCNSLNYQITAAHSDSPSLKIKENPEIMKAGHYVELNVEKYGGMLCRTWFDRPLSIAGRVTAEIGEKIHTILIDFGRDLVMLPSLAIHMDRSANDSGAIKVQYDMLPLFGDEMSAGKFMELLAEAADIEPKQILGHDLFLYNRTPSSVWGANNEYFSSTKLDDLMCAYSSVKAFIDSSCKGSINVCCIFDNEEIGSSTKQGADSTFLQDTLERISDSLGLSHQQHLMMIRRGFLLSADNAHAVHPNHIDRADPVNQPYMNGGVVIKYNAAQKYTTDAVSGAIFKKICEKANVPVQIFVNNSDIPGGSTLGNISTTHVSMNSVDIGCAQLAMHSAYETAGTKDTAYMYKAIQVFFSTHITKNDDGSYSLA